jgi:hypothetical protein
MHVFKLQGHQTEEVEERDRRESAPSPAEIIKDASDLEFRHQLEVVGLYPTSRLQYRIKR